MRALALFLALATAAGCRSSASPAPPAAPSAPAAPAAPDAPARPRGDVVISANQGDRTIHVVEVETGRNLARLSGFDGPHEVAVSPDGRWAVVSDYGNQAVQGRRLVVLDLTTFEVARTIDLGEYRRPHDLYFMPGGRQLAVTVEVNRAVLLVDFASGRVERALDTQQRGSHMMAITPDGRRIYSANMADGSVTVLDLEGTAAPRVIPVAPANEGIGLSPDGTQLWVTSLENGTVTALDTRTWETLGTMPATGFPYRVTFSPDGRRAFVPAPEENLIRVFDVATRTETRVAVAGAPGRVTIAPDGLHAYFPLHEANGVGVLDLATLTLVRTLPSGGGPDGVGVSTYYRR